MTGEKLSLLAIFAHPEDESFGPAGTLAKYASEGVQVSLVTATRVSMPSVDQVPLANPLDVNTGPRDRSCSCRSSAIRRACFFDYRPGQLQQLDPLALEDQLVRLIREVQPQVIVTLGEEDLSGDSDHSVINRVTTAAFEDAGDPAKFEDHFLEGLGAHSAQKLYYCVLPKSLVDRWGIRGVAFVPDEEVTTKVDVSSYSESMKNALYCQRSHAPDFIRWLTEEQSFKWDKEYYLLAESLLYRKARKEKDLFAGLR